jgi:hypothetical protein
MSERVNHEVKQLQGIGARRNRSGPHAGVLQLAQMISEATLTLGGLSRLRTVETVPAYPWKRRAPGARAIVRRGSPPTR